MVNSTTLKNLAGLSGLQPKTLAAIAQRAFTREVKEGCNLLIEGMPAEACYFILSGQLRVSRMNREGRTQVLARLGPGAPVNIISLLRSPRGNHASVEALTSATLLVLQALDFDFLVDHYPDFSSAMLRLFADRLAKMIDLAADLSLYPVRARLAQFLMDLADQPQAAGGWAQDEIAAQIGTVRDVVGRLLRDFESEGLIKRDRQQIILLNREEMQQVSLKGSE